MLIYSPQMHHPSFTCIYLEHHLAYARSACSAQLNNQHSNKKNSKLEWEIFHHMLCKQQNRRPKQEAIQTAAATFLWVFLVVFRKDGYFSITLVRGKKFSLRLHLVKKCLAVVWELASSMHKWSINGSFDLKLTTDYYFPYHGTSYTRGLFLSCPSKTIFPCIFSHRQLVSTYIVKCITKHNKGSYGDQWPMYAFKCDILMYVWKHQQSNGQW